MNDFFKSFVYAFKGIKESLLQRSIKIHLTAMVLSIVMGFYFSISLIEWCIVLLCIALVISLEIINTAIEYLVNMVSPDKHPLAGKIKDLSAGAVLIAAISALICGLMIFGKYILALL